ncbi:unnamed protein product, partial [Heterotrigona itama]
KRPFERELIESKRKSNNRGLWTNERLLDTVKTVQSGKMSVNATFNAFGIPVAWMKSDSRAILAIHTHLIAHNPRLSVTHNGHNTWKLHVSDVQKNDSGAYMCQVNTEPMRSQ